MLTINVITKNNLDWITGLFIIIDNLKRVFLLLLYCRVARWMLDSKIKLNFHVDYTTAKSLSKLVYLPSLLIIIPFYVYTTPLFALIYNTDPLFRKLFIYVSACFRIIKVQKEFTRFIFFKLVWQIRCYLFRLEIPRNPPKSVFCFYNPYPWS